MMYKEQIERQIDMLRREARIIERRYRAYPNDENFDQLMLYKSKIDSWKRVMEKAPHMKIMNDQGEVVTFEPKKHLSLKEILAGACLPGEVWVSDERL